MDVTRILVQLILAEFCIIVPVQGSEKLSYVICVEDYHKQIQTQFLIQSPSAISDVRADKDVACAIVFSKPCMGAVVKE